MNTEIIIKIKKLLSLSKSPNENEAKLAMLKVQELLVKYKLSLTEVINYKEQKSNVVKEESNITFRTAKWKANLARIIAENYGCYSYFRTNKTHMIMFLGNEEDAYICKLAFEYAIDSIEATFKRIKKEYIKQGTSIKGLKTNYALGFIDGLKIAFDKQKETHKEWSLVLVKDKAVEEAYNNMNFSRTINTHCEPLTCFYDVYDKGFQDGERFNLSERIVDTDIKDMAIMEE
ncbi:MAG: DUF2786 domain-containing protein [Clostridium sp.]|nr:DUF2786 domain-containing protein [Clostridium sp.]